MNKIAGMGEELRLGADTSISISAKQHETLKIGEQQETTEKPNTGPNLEAFGIPSNGLPDAQNPQESIRIIETTETPKRGLFKILIDQRKRN